MGSVDRAQAAQPHRATDALRLVAVVAVAATSLLLLGVALDLRIVSYGLARAQLALSTARYAHEVAHEEAHPR